MVFIEWEIVVTVCMCNAQELKSHPFLISHTDIMY